MRDILTAIEQHPIAFITLALFILFVLDAIKDMIKK